MMETYYQLVKIQKKQDTQIVICVVIIGISFMSLYAIAKKLKEVGEDVKNINS